MEIVSPGSEAISFHQLHRQEDAFIVFLIFLRRIQGRLENFTGVKWPCWELFGYEMNVRDARSPRLSGDLHGRIGRS